MCAWERVSAAHCYRRAKPLTHLLEIKTTSSHATSSILVTESLQVQFLLHLAPSVSHLLPHPTSNFSIQMWSRWPLTGWPETSTLWTTWMTGSSCVTRMGRHVLPSWIRSCTTPKASLWTPPWGECGHFLKVRREGHHTNFVQQLRCVIHRCYSTLKYVEIEGKKQDKLDIWKLE